MVHVFIYPPIPEVGSFSQKPSSQMNSQFIGIQSQAQGLSVYLISF